MKKILLMIALVWISKDFYTLSSAIDFLNTLPESRQLEAKIAIAEQKSKDANVKLDSEIKKKNKVIVENRVVYKDRIKQVEKIIDAECKVAPEAIDIHNAAAKNVKLEPLK